MENEMYVYTEFQRRLLDDSKQIIMEMKWHVKYRDAEMTHTVRASTNVYNI